MSWIQTYTGVKFDLLDPQPDMVRIEDIAHALSGLPRFTAHTRKTYTVAQHSWLVADLLPDEHKLDGLMHDASEAYVNDLATPLKRNLPDYKVIEGRVWAAIRERFNLSDDPAVEATVKRADLRLLLTERRDLMGPPPDRWSEDLEAIPPLAYRIRPWWFRWLIKWKFLNDFHAYSIFQRDAKTGFRIVEPASMC